MLRKGLFKKRAAREFFSIVASLVIHGVLLCLLFLTIPSNPPVITPPIQVHLVQLSQQNTPPVVNKKKESSTAKKIIKKKSKAVEVNTHIDKAKVERKKSQEQKSKKEALLRKEAALKKKQMQELADKKLEQEKRKKREEIEQDKLQKFAAEQLAKLHAAQANKNKEEATKEQLLVAKYTAVIRQKISENWRYPLNAKKQMKTIVKLILSPIGEIISLSLVSGSNNHSFDQSVIQAVRAAAPFTILNNLNIHIFEKNFRSIILTFTPQDLME